MVIYYDLKKKLNENGKLFFDGTSMGSIVLIRCLDLVHKSGEEHQIACAIVKVCPINLQIAAETISDILTFNWMPQFLKDGMSSAFQYVGMADMGIKDGMKNFNIPYIFINIDRDRYCPLEKSRKCLKGFDGEIIEIIDSNRILESDSVYEYKGGNDQHFSHAGKREETKIFATKEKLGFFAHDNNTLLTHAAAEILESKCHTQTGL